MEKLTAKQARVLNYLKQSIAENGYPPTVREICKALDLSSPATVQSHLNILEEKGYIKKSSLKNRTVEKML